MSAMPILNFGKSTRFNRFVDRVDKDKKETSR